MYKLLTPIKNNVKLLRAPTDDVIVHTVYSDRMRVDISKSVRRQHENKKLYRYIVHSYFIYEGKEVHTQSNYVGMKRALKHASDIFRMRNQYMINRNYKLSTSLLVRVGG